jgi:hypothetical protein
LSNSEPIDPGYIVEDASNEEQVNFEAVMEDAEDKMKEEGYVKSASEFEDSGDLPERLLFGELECRAISLRNWITASSIMCVVAVLLSVPVKDTLLFACRCFSTES